MTKRALEPAHFPYCDYRQLACSLGVETREGIWLSGAGATRFDSLRSQMVVEGDIVEQSCIAYEKIRLVLRAAGLGFRNIVRTVEYVAAAGMEAYPRTEELYRRVFEGCLPATSTVVVNGLTWPGALIEIEAVATRDGARAQGVRSRYDGSATAGWKVGDVLYVPGVTAWHDGGASARGPSDIVEQARQIYERVEGVLRAAGFGWEHVVKTVEFLAPAGLSRYRETSAVRKAYLSARYPASTGVIMERLVDPGALLQVDFVAVAGVRETVNPGWARYDRLTYVPGVRVGNLLFLSGQGAINPETQAVEHVGDVAGQTRYIYGNLSQVLAAAGGGPEAIVKLTEFLTAPALPVYRAVETARREFFEHPYPAVSSVVCDRLLRPEMLIEVDAVAVVA